MPLFDSLLNVGADAMAAEVALLSLHSADPGTTGANETTAARVAPSWAPATGGDFTTAGVHFTGGTPGAPVTHVGLWSADGTFHGYDDIDTETSDLTFNAAGEYSVNSMTFNGSSS